MPEGFKIPDIPTMTDSPRSSEDVLKSIQNEIRSRIPGGEMSGSWAGAAFSCPAGAVAFSTRRNYPKPCHWAIMVEKMAEYGTMIQNSVLSNREPLRKRLWTRAFEDGKWNRKA